MTDWKYRFVQDWRCHNGHTGTVEYGLDWKGQIGGYIWYGECGCNKRWLGQGYEMIGEPELLIKGDDVEFVSFEHLGVDKPECSRCGNTRTFGKRYCYECGNKLRDGGEKNEI